MWPFRRRSRAGAVVLSPELASETMFRWQRGRKYLVGAPYMLPKDLEESNRLDFQHYAIRYALKGNFAAPITDPRAILDVGTGTGRWARELAVLFPQAHVVGADVIEPPVDQQSTLGSSDLRPPNYEFVAANVLEGLPFADGSFDFVHQRLLFLAIPADRWPFAVRELARVTAPGGWVELVESGMLVNAGKATDTYQNWTQTLGSRRGVDMRVSPLVGDHLPAAGLVRVERHTVQVPLGRWGGRLGQMMGQNIQAAFHSVRPAIVGQGLATEAEVDSVLAALPGEWEQRHTTAPFYLAWAQRPPARR